MPGGTPYITPAMLAARPAGISWLNVPTLTADTAAQQAQIAQECWAATSAVDRYCRHPLRASVLTESGRGPGLPRVYADRSTGLVTLVTRSWPVVTVEAVQYALAPPFGSFPPAWQAVPGSAWNIRTPVLTSAAGGLATGPSGGNVIDLAPGYVDWSYGRGGYEVMWSYAAGWPHAGITGTAAAGASVLEVDDVTAWAGWSGYLYDGVSSEQVTVTTAEATAPVSLPGAGGTVQAGPGTLTLSGPLAYEHSAGAVVSALPPDVIEATALQAAVQALLVLEGIAVQSMSGRAPGGTGVLATEVEMMLDDYRRVA